MQGNTNIVLLRQSFHHIGAYSGYENFIPALRDEQANYAEVFRVRSLQRFDLRRRLLYTQANKRKAGKIGPYYDVFSYIAEMEALRAVRLKRARVLHNTHLEDNHGYLGKSDKPFALVATAHQPVSWWKMSGKNTALLQQLDQLIVLNNACRDFFDQYMPGRVQMIHHAVDTCFFAVHKPIEERPNRILFVGNWMRDILFLVDTLETVIKQSGDIMIDLVHPKTTDTGNPILRLCRYPQVTMHHGISDEALRDLYNNARVLFIPFIDTTANNALLEAAACGVPVVTNELPGVKEYSHPAYAYYYQSKNDCADYLVQMIKNDTQLQQMSAAARKHAGQFSIAYAASAHAALYRQLA